MLSVSGLSLDRWLFVGVFSELVDDTFKGVGVHVPAESVQYCVYTSHPLLFILSSTFLRTLFESSIFALKPRRRNHRQTFLEEILSSLRPALAELMTGMMKNQENRPK